MSKLILKIAVSLAILLGGLMVTGNKDLNETGKCYAEHDHSLATCEPKKERSN